MTKAANIHFCIRHDFLPFGIKKWIYLPSCLSAWLQQQPAEGTSCLCHVTVMLSRLEMYFTAWTLQTGQRNLNTDKHIIVCCTWQKKPKQNWSCGQTCFAGGEHSIKQPPLLMKIWCESVTRVHTQGSSEVLSISSLVLFCLLSWWGAGDGFLMKLIVFNLWFLWLWTLVETFGIS